MTAIATSPRQQQPLVPQTEMDQITKLDETSKAANAQLIKAELDRNDMAKGLIMARAMKVLRGLLTEPVMADVMELQGSVLGFRTDRDRDGGYKREEVRDVLVQALIRGLRPTGNEINIIAGNLYVTKEGFERLLREFPGLTNLAIEVGVPAVVAGTTGESALVPCKASWDINGKHDELLCEKDYRIPIRVNKSMGVDAIQGKAKSKLYRRIYERLTGTVVATEADSGDVIEGTAEAVQA